MNASVKRLLFPFLAGALVGGLCIFAFRPSPSPSSASASDTRNLSKIRELQRRIRELEKRPVAAATPATNAVLAAEVTNLTDFAETERFIRECDDGTTALALGDALQSAAFREELAKMKTTCPELYEAITGAINEHVDRTVEAATRRIEALSVFDSVMTDPADLECHRELMELSAQVGMYQTSLNAYEGEVQSPSARKVDTALAAIASDAVSDLLSEERTSLLRKVAAELGCQGEDADAVVDTINAIVEATSPNADADTVTLIDSVNIASTPVPTEE